VRHWHDLILSAYERDLVTNEKVYFQSLDPNRTFEEFFFLPRVLSTSIRGLWRNRGELVNFKVTCTLVSLACPISFDVSIHAKRSEESLVA